MFLSIRLNFCQFQLGVACKSVAYKKKRVVSMDKSYQNYLFTEGDVNSNVYKKVSLDSDKNFFKEVTLSAENKKK